MKMQTRTNVSNLAVECNCMFKKPTYSKKKNKSRDIGVSP